MFRLCSYFKEYNLKANYIQNSNTQWHILYKKSSIDFDLEISKKSEKATAHVILLFQLQQDPSNIIAYTDGSKILETRIGAGTYILNQTEYSWKLNKELEVFNAKIIAVYLTLKQLINAFTSKPVKNTETGLISYIWVFSTSSSALKSISNCNYRYAYKIYQLAN
jgi:hypothetical protein